MVLTRVCREVTYPQNRIALSVGNADQPFACSDGVISIATSTEMEEGTCVSD